MAPDTKTELSGNDSKLIEEAVRRMKRSHIPAPWTDEEMYAVLSREVQGGRRDLFGLIRATRRALNGSDA